MEKDFILEDIKKVEELNFGYIYYINYINDKNIYFVHKGNYGQLSIKVMMLPNENSKEIKHLEIYDSISSINREIQNIYLKANENGLAVFRKDYENYDLKVLFDIRNNNPHIVKENINQEYELMFKEKASVKELR